MTIIAWRILCIVSAVLFVAGMIALAALRILKNKYYHGFTEDELFKREKQTNSRNAIYFTSGETQNYVRKYVLCKTAYDTYLVCNYAKAFQEITYFVVEYTAKKKVLSARKITERGTSETSKVIALSRRCAYVNVIIGEADGAVINSDVVRPLSLTRIRIYALIKNVLVFLGLFVARQVILEIIGMQSMKPYLTSYWNYIAVGASFLLCLIGYFITVKGFRRKNVKALNGGALEYEFV